MMPVRATIVRILLVVTAPGLLLASWWTVQMDARTWGLVRNMLGVAVGTCALSLPLGTALAFLLVRTDLPGRRTAALVIGAMLFIPLYMQMAAWHAGFCRIGRWAAAEGSLVKPLLDGWRAVVWIHAMAAVAWVALIVGLGLRLVEPELEEQALLDASPARVFCRITLVRAAAPAAVAALWILVTTAGEITVTDIFRVRTFAEEVYGTVGENLREARASAAAAGVVSCWLVLAALVLASRLAPPERTGSLARARTFPLGKWKGVAAACVALLAILLAGVPLAQLCWDAGMTVQPGDEGLRRVWSLGKLLRIVGTTPGRYGEEFGWTLLIGAAAASLAVGVAMPLGWLARRGGLHAVPTLLATAIGLAVPGPLIGVGLEWLLNREQSGLMIWLYDRTILAPTLAMAVRALPIATLILWYSFRSIGQDQLDSAATEGAGPVVRFWQVAARQRMPALGAAWLAALVVAWGDLSASILVLPPQVDTIQRRVFGLVHYAYYDRVAGICLVSAIGFVAVAAVTYLLFVFSHGGGRAGRPAPDGAP